MLQILKQSFEGTTEQVAAYGVLVAGTYAFAGYFGHNGGSGTATVYLRDMAGALLSTLAVVGAPTTASDTVVIAATTAVQITVTSSITNFSDGVSVIALALQRSL